MEEYLLKRSKGALAVPQKEDTMPAIPKKKGKKGGNHKKTKPSTANEIHTGENNEQEETDDEEEERKSIGEANILRIANTIAKITASPSTTNRVQTENYTQNLET